VTGDRHDGLVGVHALFETVKILLPVWVGSDSPPGHFHHRPSQIPPSFLGDAFAAQFQPALFQSRGQAGIAGQFFRRLEPMYEPIIQILS
jgi:hypothetical protein